MKKWKSIVVPVIFGLTSSAISFGALSAEADTKAKTKPAAPAEAKPTPAPASAPAPASEAKSNDDAKTNALIAYHQRGYRDALRLFQPLADKGDAEAQYYVGRMYEKGQGVSKDQEQVVRWYTRSAEGGYAPAQYRLAVGYAMGFAGLKRNDQEAVKWLQRSAEGGYKRAQKTLARAYAEGRFGLPEDPAKAEYWTKKSEQPG